MTLTAVGGRHWLATRRFASLALRRLIGRLACLCISGLCRGISCGGRIGWRLGGLKLRGGLQPLADRFVGDLRLPRDFSRAFARGALGVRESLLSLLERLGGRPLGFGVGVRIIGIGFGRRVRQFAEPIGLLFDLFTSSLLLGSQCCDRLGDLTVAFDSPLSRRQTGDRPFNGLLGFLLSPKRLVRRRLWA